MHLKNFNPVLPNDTKIKIHLPGNIDPILQMRVLDQVVDPQFVVCDTITYG